MAEYISGIGNKEDIKPAVLPVGEEQLAYAQKTLQEYKAGKSNLEAKIIKNEEWWKLRHWQTRRNEKNKFTPATAYLWNAIVTKSADMLEAFPEPNILPREPNDKYEAKMLSSIIPVILEQNDFKRTYAHCCEYKLKNGTAIYKIVWDGNAHNGLGDVSIVPVDAVNLFWEPGITDVQKSKNLFHAELVDVDFLKGKYPQLVDVNLSDDGCIAKYLYDDAVDTSNKATVVDWYYKKNLNGRVVLHLVKFVGNHLLYASENETIPPTKSIGVNPETGNTVSEIAGDSMSISGIYAHAKYPYVFDTLFEISGSPFGYGYIDIAKDTQVMIDQINASVTKNTLMAAKRRYFVSDAADVNKDEFADWEQDLVSVSTMPTEDTIREITVNPLSGTYVQVLNNQIDMLKEITGNRDVNNGSSTSGITAASAIASLQEAGAKQSKSAINTTYEAYKEIVYFVIELIRQFYDTPRQFRITGEQGQMEFVSYNNGNIVPQAQGNDFGVDMGYRVPEFDITVSAQKANVYSKISQNELMLQFYQLQFFNPSNATQALSCLEGMDFDGKDEVIQKVQQNGTILSLFQNLFNFAMGMAQTYDTSVIPALQSIGMQAGIMDATQMIAGADVNLPETDAQGNYQRGEHPVVEKARARANRASQPNV